MSRRIYSLILYLHVLQGVDELRLRVVVRAPSLSEAPLVGVVDIEGLMAQGTRPLMLKLGWVARAPLVEIDGLMGPLDDRLELGRRC